VIRSVIKVLQLKTKLKNKETTRLMTKPQRYHYRSSKTKFSIARELSYTGRIQSPIFDHIVKSTTVKIV